MEMNVAQQDGGEHLARLVNVHPVRPTVYQKRQYFREISTPSIDESADYVINSNGFFGSHNGAIRPVDYTNDVIDEISFPEMYGNEEEGFENGPNTLGTESCYKRSASAPSRPHKPLSKEQYDSNRKIQKGISLQESRGLSQDNDDKTMPDKISSNASNRRESFKESGYGGSEGSAETSTETNNTDDVFDDVNVIQRKPSIRLRRMVSRDPDLITVDELRESRESSLNTNSTNSVVSVCAQSPAVSTRIASKQLTNFPQEIPDFDFLLSGRTSCSEVVSCSSSPDMCDVFTSSCLVNKPSRYSYSSPKDSLSQDDVVFRIGSLSESIDIASLELYTESKQRHQQSDKHLYAEHADNTHPMPIVDLNSLPSLHVDMSHKSEDELICLYQLHQKHFHNQRIKDYWKRGDVNGLITLIRRIESDSDWGSVSDFTTEGSTTTLLSSSSGSSANNAQTILPPTQPQPVEPTPTDSTGTRHLQANLCPEIRLSSSSNVDVELLSPSFDVEGQLLRGACCRQKHCPDNKCQQGQRLVMYVERFLEQSDIDTAVHGNIVLTTISDHANLCDELKCPMPWCTFFHEHDLPFEEQVAELHAANFSGHISLTSGNSDMNDFELLARSQETGYTEHVHWSSLARLGNYGNAVLAVTTSVKNPSYWVVKKENKDLLLHAEVLRKLKKRFHPRIVQHLWILEQEDHLFIASKFEGASVADRMSESGRQGLPIGRVWKYMEQLTSATQFLHRNEIAYLNWTAENVLLSTDMRFVKLCNFSYAVLLDKIRDDFETLEDLKMLLPPRIVPPEVYQDDNVVPVSDVWGLGCVMYQMTTGHMIYHELRHYEPATVRDMLEKSPEPELTAIEDDTARDILCQCLHMHPKERILTADLHKYLAELGSRQ